MCALGPIGIIGLSIRQASPLLLALRVEENAEFMLSGLAYLK